MTTHETPKATNSSKPLANAADAETPHSSQAGKNTGSDTGPPPSGISQDIQNHLGRKLKASYDELVRRPVPERFRQLLEELEKREKK